MTLSLVITNAGRAAITTAQSDGTNAITIAKVGVTASVFTPLATQTALPGEIKKLTAVSGGAIAPATIHLSATDASSDVYDLHGFGLYLPDNTLFAIYSQAATILSKAAGALGLLSGDIVFSGLGAVTVTVGDTTFLNPPATTEVQGVVELATSAETIAKTDTTRAVTVKGLWDAFSNWISTAMAGVWTSSNDGAGSGLDADLLDGQHAAYFLPTASYTAADVKAKLLTVDGAGSLIDADLLDGQQGAYYSNIPARLGFSPLDAASYTAADILTKLKTVDGSGSGVDADLLDGQHGAYYADVLARLGYTPADLAGDTFTGAIKRDANFYMNISGDNPILVVDADAYLVYDRTNNQFKFYIGNALRATLYATGVLNTTGGFTYAGNTVWNASNDGAGSGLDADLLDGQEGSYYTNITARLGYTPLNATAYTAADVLTKLKTVDGSGSGVDADLLDGQHGSWYTDIPSRLGYTPLNATAYTAADVLTKLKTVDGSGSGIDADLLDGQHLSALVQKANIMADLATAMALTWVGPFGANKFYLGDLLVQTGVVSTIGANGSATINFPTHYSVAPFVIPIRRTSGAVTNADSGVGIEGTPTISQAIVRNTTAGATIDIMWIAVGPA